MTTTGGKCYSCSSDLTALDYGRQDSCGKCGRHTHVCLNCIFHDRTYNNECKEPQADRVVDKEKFNFCDYFKPKADSQGVAKAKSDLVSAAEALFKKK